MTRKISWQELGVFAALVLLAAGLRLYRLDQLPPGLHSDEAFNALMAHNVRVGIDRPIFFADNLGEEPMAMYVAAGLFALVGEAPWIIRLGSALAGIVTVAALYWLARALFQSRWFAALAAFVLAILYWHLNFSRLGMETIFTPTTLTLAFAFWWLALRNNLRWRYVALAGLCLGATMYTYKASLFVPVLAAVYLGIEMAVNRNFWRRHLRALIVFVGIAILVFAPLGLYFAAHPSDFLDRPTSVTVAAAGEPTLVDNALKVAGMFFVRGDENPRSNLPGRPALDPFLALGFGIGVIVCLTQIRRSETRFILVWLTVMSAPSIITDFAPHFGRDIGATPAIALVVAYGFGSLLRWAHHWKPAPRILRPVAYGILILGLGASAYATVNDYFNVWGARTGLFDSFDAGYLDLAQRLHDRPGNETIYLSPVDARYYTIQVALAGRDARSFDGRRALVLPPPGATATYGIVTRDDPRTRAQLAKIFPQGRVLDTLADLTGKPYAVIYRVDGAAQIAPQHPINARLGDTIQLIGYDVARDQNAVTLTVYWGSIAETQTDYTVFVHVIGALNPTTQSPVWAAGDARPGGGSYPTPRWQPGEVILDTYQLTLPADAPRGEYQIELGMYNLETGARVRMTDANGVPMENDRATFERITQP